MKKLSIFLALAMLLSLCVTAFAVDDQPDYSDMSKIISMYNKSLPDDVSSYVEKPFNVVNGYLVEDGMQNGYNVVRENGTFKIANVAKSDKYFVYLNFIPLYPQADGSYSNVKDGNDGGYFYSESYYYTVDGNYADIPAEPMFDSSIKKLRKGETLEFTLPQKGISDGEEIAFSDDIIWIVAANTVHGTYVKNDSYDEFVSTVEDDYGWINYWFVKVDDAAVDAKLSAAGIDSRFYDVKTNDYFYDPIKWALEKEITNGTGVNSFSPNNTCTQAQILTFLWRANGCPEASANLDWVDNNQYYADAFKWAYENKIIEGKLDPNAPCARIDVVRYMYRLEKDAKADVSLADKMVDVAASDKAIVAWALEKGVTNGTGVNTFSPNNTCTRGQIVTFLYRAYAEK